MKEFECFKKTLISFNFLFLFLQIKIVNLTPLSFCTKGRISPYKFEEKEGTCGFNSHKTYKDHNIFIKLLLMRLYLEKLLNVVLAMKL